MLEISSQSAILHLLQHCPSRIKALTYFVPENRWNPRLLEIAQQAKEHHISISIQPKPEAKPQVSTLGELEPLAATLVATILPFQHADFKAQLKILETQTHSVLLALDHLQDPQNFGALARTAEGLGLDGILIPKDRSAQVSPGVYSASVGAIETIKVFQLANLGEALRKLKESGFWIVGAAMGDATQTLESIPKLEKSVLVLGSELEGLSPLIQKTCDFLVEIPLKGRVESLNVSVAGALLMQGLLKHQS